MLTAVYWMVLGALALNTIRAVLLQIENRALRRELEELRQAQRTAARSTAAGVYRWPRGPSLN